MAFDIGCLIEIESDRLIDCADIRDLSFLTGKCDAYQDQEKGAKYQGLQHTSSVAILIDPSTSDHSTDGIVITNSI